MISAFTNSLKIPELREKILFTLGLIFVARIGANIPLPGLDPAPLQEFFRDQASSGAGSMIGLYNMFTGGAFVKGAICALGIMPYISASIIFQLMAAVVPGLARLQKEGESGRQKITQYTRYATVGIAFVQSILLILALSNPGKLFPSYNVAEYGPIVLGESFPFMASSVVILTAGAILLMWLGEQITQRGIGNGVSILITVGILADAPSAATMLYQRFTVGDGVEGQLGLPAGILMLVLLFVVVMGVIAVVQAVRKIPVQYAKRVVGRKVYGGQSSYLPLKVNYAGVMPVIFAGAILMFLASSFQWAAGALDWGVIREVGGWFQHRSVNFYIIQAILIFAFSYFWVSVMFKPVQIADDLKKYQGFVPGVRPGEPTAKFLDFVMTRLTLAGAIFLTVIAVFPDIVLGIYNVPYVVAQFFGGTGLLIIVGVVLDTLRQMETYLLQRHYDGFLRKGRIKGRSPSRARASATVDTSELKNLGKLWTTLAIIFVLGMAAWVVNLYLDAA